MESVPAPQEPLRAPPSRPNALEELHAWAQERGAAKLVQQRVGEEQVEFPPELRPYQQFIRTTQLDELVCYTPTTAARIPGFVTPEQVEQLRDAAWRYVQKKAAALQQGVARARDADASLPALPEDPGLRQLVELLRAERDRLRAIHGMLPPVEEAQVTWDPAKRELRVSAPALPSATLIELENWETKLEFRDGSNGSDVYAGKTTLLAVEAAMRTLWMQPQAVLARSLVQTLRQPGWAKELGELLEVHQRFVEGQKPAPESQLSWRVRLNPGSAALTVLLHRRTKKGTWGTGTETRAAKLLEDGDALFLPGERRALHLLANRDQVGGLGAGAALPALAHLQGHPRVFLEREPEGPPWDVHVGRLGMAVVPAAQGAWALAPAVDSTAVDAKDVLQWIATEGSQRPGCYPWADAATRRLTVATVTPETRELLTRISQRKPRFPPEAVPELLAFTAQLESQVPVTLPPELRGELVPAAPHAVVRLTPLEDVGLRVEVLARPLLGALPQVPGAGPVELHGTQENRRVCVLRNLEDEVVAARERTAEWRLRPESEEPAFVFTLDRGEEALDLVTRLQEQQDGQVVVEWVGEAWNVARATSTKLLRVAVEKRRDWFGVQGSLEVEGEQVQLAVLLDALRHKRRYVKVSEARFVALGQELRERLQAVAAGTFGEDKGLTLGPAAALALAHLAPELGEVKADVGFSAFRYRLQAARDVDPALPAGLETVMRDYQKDGFRWLMRLAAWGGGACLADDMGLGKTLQALAVLRARGEDGPALVVCPTSVCRNWVEEAARFSPSLHVRLYREIPDAERAAAVLEQGPRDVLVVSYGMLTREAERLAARPFGTLVLDEAQAVKNAATRRAAACRKLDAGFKVALTGTPLENHLGELWSLFRVVFPGLLGSWEEYRERFAGPIERQGDAERRAALVSLCRPFLLRRTKAQVAPELPPRTEMTVLVEPSAGEQRLYEQARLSTVARLSGLGETTDEKQRFEVLSALTRLRLCACHPRLYDENSTLPSAKLNRLMELLEELREEGQRALVFSQFTSLLALVRAELDRRGLAYLYLDGSTPAAKRDDLVHAFQAGQGGDAFLISLRAGGTGLNLTAATCVIHLDPWWNPAVEDQASDRAHRIGQDKPVTVVRLAARGTVEQQILALHQDKRALVASVLDGAETAARLSTQELLDLIRCGAATVSEDAPDDEGAEAPPPGTAAAS